MNERQPNAAGSGNSMTTRVRRWAPRLGLPSGDMWEMPVRPTPSRPAVEMHTPRDAFRVPTAAQMLSAGQGTLNRLLPVKPVGLGVCLVATANQNSFMIIPPAGHE